MRAGNALERLSGPAAQGASGATAGGGGLRVLQSAAHISLLGYTHILRGCAVLCAEAGLGEAAAVQLCRAVRLLTGAGRTLLVGSAGGGSDLLAARSNSALQQLLALNACVNSVLALQREGRPVRDAGALFQPAPVLRWLEAVADALLAGQAHNQLMPGKAAAD